LINNFCFRNITCAVFLAATIVISGCAQNVRELSSDAIAGIVKHVSRPDLPDLIWFAPELHVSHYRTLFYGYDTVDYRLAAPEHPGAKINNGFRLLVDAHYGGNVRHYNFVKMPDASTREVSHKQHDAERCQIFNSLISSCLNRDRFSLNLSKSELELGQTNGIKILLRSEMQEYETLDLPSHYIQGFLKAVTGSIPTIDPKNK
jgi:hypothetical protein